MATSMWLAPWRARKRPCVGSRAGPLDASTGRCACVWKADRATPRDEQHTRDTTANSLLLLLLSRHQPCQVNLLRTSLLEKGADDHRWTHCVPHARAAGAAPTQDKIRCCCTTGCARASALCTSGLTALLWHVRAGRAGTSKSFYRGLMQAPFPLPHSRPGSP